MFKPVNKYFEQVFFETLLPIHSCIYKIHDIQVELIYIKWCSSLRLGEKKNPFFDRLLLTALLNLTLFVIAILKRISHSSLYPPSLLCFIHPFFVIRCFTLWSECKIFWSYVNPKSFKIIQRRVGFTSWF